MDLDHLELTSFTLHNLYRNSVIKIDNEGGQKPLEANETKYLGANQQHIAMIVNNKDLPFLADGELSFLTKILAACKLTLADIAILNMESIQEEILPLLKNKLKIKQVVLFGPGSLDIKLPFQIPFFQVQAFDSVQYLSVPVLTSIEQDKELKKQLWVCFQKMFLP